MNYRLVFQILSLIVFALALAFAVSMGAGLLEGTSESEARAVEGFGWSIGICLVLAGVLFLMGRGASLDMLRKEALAVIGLGWLLASVLSALPYLFIMEDVDVANALFEATSGITTTGASVFTGYEEWSRGLLFWRCMSQWIGGLGVVVLFVALLSSLGASGKILFTNESTGTSAEIETGRVQQGALQLMLLYIVLSILCAGALYFLGMSPYEAICHSFTSISTGGFSTHSGSIGGFENPAIEWALIFFMIVGATSFLIMLKMIARHWHDVRRNDELPIYYGILFGSAVLMTLILAQTGFWAGWEPTIRAAVFQVVSISSTTGYASEDFGEWALPAEALLLVLMFIGGSSGSTAGGTKVVRIIIILRLVVHTIEKTYRSRVVRPIRVNGRIIRSDSQEAVAIFMVMNGGLILVSLVTLSLLEPDLDLLTAFSAIFSCLYNIGPGFGEVGPTHVFDFLTGPSKVLLSFLMILGRLELYAVLALFAPALWRRFS